MALGQLFGVFDGQPGVEEHTAPFVFGVGAVEIFTAGDNPEIVVAGLPEPNRVRELIKTEQGNARSA